FLADIELAADDGLDAILVCCVYKMHRTENISVVRHGHGGHAEFSDSLAKLFDVAGAVEQRVIRVQMQVNELGCLAHVIFDGAILTGNASVEPTRYPQN